MAGRTQSTVTTISRAAITTVANPSVAADAVNGNFCLNDGATTLRLLNSDSSTHTLTVALASGVDGATAGPKSYTVAVSGSVQEVGPFPIQFYGGQLNFNLDSALVRVLPVSTFGP